MADSPGAPDRVLYRCRIPTNFLCPCGAVARRLRKKGLEFRTERVAVRRADRHEILELTGQERVPVLVEGEEVIHDSRRILEYLDWASAPERRKAAGKGSTMPGDV
jgi:glutathione S-transferase